MILCGIWGYITNGGIRGCISLMLIVVGDMRWNPATLRWEGNDSVLRGFESPVHSARPALITHLTGSSSLGGLGSPTAGSLTSGARVVGNMIFDPAKMCWINRFEDEEDPFADMSDDDDDDETDKDVTWGKKRGATIATIRARSATMGGIPSSGTPLETVTASPARSAASRASTRTMASGSASNASESDSESVMLRPPPSGTGTASSRPSIETSTTAASDAGDDAESSHHFDEDHDHDLDFDHDDRLSGSGGIGSPDRSSSSRADSSARHYRGASTSPIPGVDENMVFGCREAENRHQVEMKGWFISRRKHRHLGGVTPRAYSSIRRRIGMVTLEDGDAFDEDLGVEDDEDDDDEEDDDVVDRSYLFAIRDLATRKY